MSWFSVKERTPENDREYLIRMTILFPSTRVALYRDNIFSIRGEDITKWVTHWQPLPKPPKD